ncbi:MAG: energy-coupling factor ABC transporter permease [Endomicrobium sp.]|jgi:cobalt/nickel transport system permease protein|nr:energy-coupling factor ABC transporter permease [Endomicrobium sp.]
MHIPDGFLSNNLAGGLLTGAIGMLVYCFSQILKTIPVLEESEVCSTNSRQINLQPAEFSKYISKYFYKLGLISIWVFAFQMFNIPIKSATSAHLLGGVFACVLSGPYAGFIIMSLILTIQALLFSDGGLLSLGANILNMAFIGSFLSYYVYKFFSKKNYYLGIFAASFFSVMTASSACLIELGLSGSISFSTAFKNMMSIHAAAACLETLMTIILLRIFKTING